MGYLVANFLVCSGSAIMQNGSTVRNGYKLDLDSLRIGSCIGMMRSSDGTLHYYLNGVDQGVACSGIPTGRQKCYSSLCNLAFMVLSFETIQALHIHDSFIPAISIAPLQVLYYSEALLTQYCAGISRQSATGNCE